jgi:hypothetical protein
MPLSLIRSDSNAALWSACLSTFLDRAGQNAGPDGHTSFLWLTHRTQRDALLEEAARLGLAGWLAPPFAFFSELREMFGIEARPVGILTGRMLVARLAGRHAVSHGLTTAGEGGSPAGSHMLDRVFSELLPEGVSHEALRAALETVGGDEFAARRNEWVADTYSDFLGELERRDLYDPRSIHSMVAERIENGGLRAAIGGAGTLHVYGLTSLRGRRRLFRALAEQDEVLARVYLPTEEEPSEWETVASPVAEPPAVSPSDAAPGTPVPSRVEVQPTPDAIREAAWVARRVKRLLADGTAEPHEVAVVARSGHRDTRRVHTALEAAGVPSTARLRTVLAEVPALKAMLGLLRSQADGWPYDGLRQVLSSPYFRVGVDLRAVDYLAARRRFQGLAAWEEALTRLRSELDEDGERRLNRRGLYADRLDEDIPRFRAFREAAAPLDGRRPETEWIDVTLALLRGDHFDLRRSLCLPVGDRHDLVRLDQRGVLQVESLLREWKGLVDVDQEMDVGEWYTRLYRLLSANDLALSTPMQEGVQVLEAHEAALTPFRHVFVVHANDGEFPRTQASNGVFSDEERSRLQAAGLSLTNREEAMRRERTLWRAVTGNESVVVTYRTTDSAGTPRLPSLLVPDHDVAGHG